MNNNNFSRTEWRKSKVMELSSQGYTQSEIAKILQISQPTISRDIQYLKQLARTNITKYIDHELPFEYDKCLAALNSLQKKAWEISDNEETDEKTKVQALSLAKECVINKLELLTNATVVNDATNFITEKKQQLSKKLNSVSSRDDNKKSNKELKSKKFEEKLEKETAESIITTINHVF
jgi:predicted transcriptional regulator